MLPFVFLLLLALAALAGYFLFRSGKEANAARKKPAAIAIFGIAVALLLAAMEHGIVLALAIAAGAAVVAIVWYFLDR